jgi:hypothetical protein
MELSPDTPRHLFIEEAPEFVPQRAAHRVTAQCKEAVERLVRLGRNRGYGVTLISQRPATVDKDVLSQCENLFVLRTPGPHDRRALEEWIEAKATARGLEKFLGELAGLANGTAWFWSPQWLDRFERVRIRQRMTYHPGATRTIGEAPKAVALADVGRFVEQLKRQLTKTTYRKQVAALNPGDVRVIEHPDEGPLRVRVHSVIKTPAHNASLEYASCVTAEIDSLRAQLNQERQARADAERRLAKVRDALRPQYEALASLFSELSGAAVVGVDRSAFEPWLAKAGRAGCKRLLEVLIERGELTRPQLGTLAGIGHNTGTFRNYLSWMRRNGLVKTEGSTVRLIQL